MHGSFSNKIDLMKDVSTVSTKQTMLNLFLIGYNIYSTNGMKTLSKKNVENYLTIKWKHHFGQSKNLKLTYRGGSLSLQNISFGT